MRVRLFALLILLAMLLSSCGYWVVEERPVQIGSAVAQENALR